MKSSLSGAPHQKQLATAAYVPIAIILAYVALMMLTMILFTVSSTTMTVLMIAGGVGNLVIVVCVGMFIKHVTQNSSISTGAKVGWILHMILLHAIALPDYWKKQVRQPSGEESE